MAVADNAMPTLSGSRAEYAIGKAGSGYSVMHVAGVQTDVAVPATARAIRFADATVNLDIGSKAQSIALADLQSIIELYIAYFNRVPDADGLAYWIDQLKAGQTLDQIGQSFYGAAIQYSALTGYSASMTNSDFVRIVYKNVLGRETPDQDGLDYWSSSLASGRETRGTLIKSMLASAHTFKGHATYGWVADLLDNKVKLANLFAVQQGLNYNTPEDSISRTMALVAAVSATDATAAVRAMGTVDWNFRQVDTLASAPIPVERSSYENKIKSGESLGPQYWPPELYVGPALAYADFFQDGSYGMVANTVKYIHDNWSQTSFGEIRFYKKVDGQWIDRTSSLLEDTNGCLHPRKAIVADFNADRKPDVFLACHGYDRPPFPGERQHVLLSQPDGKYKNVTLPMICYCHAATAVDFSGQGYADILVTDNMFAGTPYFLVNNRDGTFTQDTARLPSTLRNKAIFSVEFLDFDNQGKYDIWLAGTEPGASADRQVKEWEIAPTILRNDGRNNYLASQPISLPTNKSFGIPLDIVYKNGKMYISRTNDDGGEYGLNYYTAAAIQVIDYKTMLDSTPYTHTADYANGEGWIDWIMSYRGKVVGMNAVYDLALPWQDATPAQRR